MAIPQTPSPLANVVSAKTYNAQWFSGATIEAQINAAITQAVTDKAAYVYIPANMASYNPSLVTLNSAVQLIREGSAPAASTFDVNAFGADPTGVADSTTAFVNCEIASRGGTFYVPQGTYLVNGQVVLQGNFRQYVQDIGATIICGNASAPCIKFAGVTTQMFGLYVRGLRVQCKNTAFAYRVPLVQFGDSNGLLDFTADQIWMDGQNGLRDGILLQDVFNGGMRFVSFVSLGGGVGITLRSGALNVGNIHFDTVMKDTYSPMFVVNDFASGGINLINSLKFTNCKTADASAAGKFFIGTASGVQNLGSTTIVLGGGQGTNYATGDWIVVVDASQDTFVERVASVSTDTLTLTNSAGLPFALANGDFVINVQGCHSVLGPITKAVKYEIPHFERANGILCAGTSSVIVENPIFGANVNRGLVAIRAARGLKLIEPFGTTVAASCVPLHQMNDSGNARNTFVGSQELAGPGPTNMIQVDGGSSIAFTNRFGGDGTVVGIWQQETTVAASQTNVQLIMRGQTTARSFQFNSQANVVRLAVKLSSNAAGAALTATLFKNGSSTAATVTVAIGQNNGVYEAISGATQVTFAPGDVCDVRVTTPGGWTATANNLDVVLYAET